MNLDFNDTLWYISIVILGAPLVYFTTNSEFDYSTDKKKVIASMCIAPILILLVTSAIFGVDETTEKIGRLFANFLRVIVYGVMTVFICAVCWIIFTILISDNRREMINDLIKIILKIGRRNK